MGTEQDVNRGDVPKPDENPARGPMCQHIYLNGRRCLSLRTNRIHRGVLSHEFEPETCRHGTPGSPQVRLRIQGRDEVDLGLPTGLRDYQIAHVEYRCREHPHVVCREFDKCYCGKRLSVVVPAGLVYVDDDEWARMLDARNEDEKVRREMPVTYVVKEVKP